MIKLTLIPEEKILGAWDSISNWVENALGNDRSYTVDDIRTLCENGSITLWIIYDDSKPVGFLVTIFNQTPQGKTCYAPWLGGESLDRWVGLGFEQLKYWLRKEGCLSFSWVGRAAWKRLVKVDSDQCLFSINL